MTIMLREVLKELVYIPDNLLGIICDFLKKLNADKTGEFLKQFKLFLRGEFIELAELIGCLKLISGDEVISIGETDGTDTIASAHDVFTSRIDSDSMNRKTDVKGYPTKETLVQVFKIVKDGRFDQVFGDYKNIDHFCLTQSQIIRFTKDHNKWLRIDNYGTIFLCKENGGYFIVRVYWKEDGPRVEAQPLFYDTIWRAGCCRWAVVPQQ